MLLPGLSSGQQHFRIRANFSIKEIKADSSANLTSGTVYYDRSIRKVIYDVTFPAKETWIIKDTLVYKLAGGKLVEKIKASSMAEFTIFHMALAGNLDDFGVRDLPFKLTKVEKQDSMIIATWKPQEKYEKLFGKIVMSRVQRKLTGIVFFRSNGKIAGKQFFRKYQRVSGIDFPTEVLQFTNTPKGTNQQISTFRNIVIDPPNEKNLFDRPIPGK